MSRCRTPGLHPDEFGPRLRGHGTPGACGQFVNYDLRGDSVGDPLEVLREILGTTLYHEWEAGVGTRWWQGVPLIGADPIALAAGAPSLIDSPYVVEGGARLQSEISDGVAYRATAVPCNPALAEDAVALVLGVLPPVAPPLPDSGHVWSQIEPVFRGGLCIYIIDNVANAYGDFSTGFNYGSASPAGALANHGLYLAVLLLDRTPGSETIQMWTPSGAGPATAIVNHGDLPGEGLALFGDPDGSYPCSVGSGVLVSAFAKGATGLVQRLIAGSYAELKKLANWLLGYHAAMGGQPTLTRAYWAARQDQDGRWWQHPAGTLRAGNGSDALIEPARTNRCRGTQDYLRVSAETWRTSPINPDGNMEAAGVGSYTAYLITATKSGASPHSGAQALRLAYLATPAAYAYQDILTVGQRYRITGYVRGDDGVGVPQIDNNGAVLIVRGTNSSIWQPFDATITAAHARVRFLYFADAAGWCEFDDVRFELVVESVDDSAALLTAKAELFGPHVADINNTSAVDVIAWCGSAAGSTAKVAISGLVRVLAGAGVRLGLVEPATDVFTDLCAIHDGYDALTAIEDVTPTATQKWALKLPAGAHVRGCAEQLETGPCASSTIPVQTEAVDWTRYADVLALGHTPSDAQGSIEFTITPVGWSAAEVGTIGILTRTGAGANLLLVFGGRWQALLDGATWIDSGVAPAAGVAHHIRLRWVGSRSSIEVRNATTSALLGRGDGAYPGTLTAGTTWQLAPGAPVLVRDVRCYRNGSG